MYSRLEVVKWWFLPCLFSGSGENDEELMAACVHCWSTSKAWSLWPIRMLKNISIFTVSAWVFIKLHGPLLSSRTQKDMWPLGYSDTVLPRNLKPEWPLQSPRSLILSGSCCSPAWDVYPTLANGWDTGPSSLVFQGGQLKMVKLKVIMHLGYSLLICVNTLHFLYLTFIWLGKSYVFVFTLGYGLQIATANYFSLF